MNIKKFLNAIDKTDVSNKSRVLFLKQLIELNDIVVKPEKVDKELVFYKFFNDGNLTISLKALCWDKRNFKGYQIYKASLTISKEEIKNLNYKEIKFQLLEDIFRQVIKNHIMMI